MTYTLTRENSRATMTSYLSQRSPRYTPGPSTSSAECQAHWSAITTRCRRLAACDADTSSGRRAKPGSRFDPPTSRQILFASKPKRTCPNDSASQLYTAYGDRHRLPAHRTHATTCYARTTRGLVWFTTNSQRVLKASQLATS